MSECSHCDKEGRHWHHIIPKSRGGSDDPSNLIFLCLDCHSKVHDVAFKGDSGLIKDAISKSKNIENAAKKWAELYDNTLEDFFEVLEYENKYLHDYFLSAVMIDIAGMTDLFMALFTEKNRSGFKFKKCHKEEMKDVWERVGGDFLYG